MRRLPIHPHAAFRRAVIFGIGMISVLWFASPASADVTPPAAFPAAVSATTICTDGALLSVVFHIDAPDDTVDVQTSLGNLTLATAPSPAGAPPAADTLVSHPLAADDAGLFYQRADELDDAQRAALDIDLVAYSDRVEFIVGTILVEFAEVPVSTPIYLDAVDGQPEALGTAADCAIDDQVGGLNFLRFYSLVFRIIDAFDQGTTTLPTTCTTCYTDPSRSASLTARVLFDPTSTDAEKTELLETGAHMFIAWDDWVASAAVELSGPPSVSETSAVVPITRFGINDSLVLDRVGNRWHVQEFRFCAANLPLAWFVDLSCVPTIDEPDEIAIRAALDVLRDPTASDAARAVHLSDPASQARIPDRLIASGFEPSVYVPSNLNRGSIHGWMERHFVRLDFRFIGGEWRFDDFNCGLPPLAAYCQPSGSPEAEVYEMVDRLISRDTDPAAIEALQEDPTRTGFFVQSSRALTLYSSFWLDDVTFEDGAASVRVRSSPFGIGWNFLLVPSGDSWQLAAANCDDSPYRDFC